MPREGRPPLSFTCSATTYPEDNIRPASLLRRAWQETRPLLENLARASLPLPLHALGATAVESIRALNVANMAHKLNKKRRAKSGELEMWLKQRQGLEAVESAQDQPAEAGKPGLVDHGARMANAGYCTTVQGVCTANERREAAKSRKQARWINVPWLMIVGKNYEPEAESFLCSLNENRRFVGFSKDYLYESRRIARVMDWEDDIRKIPAELVSALGEFEQRVAIEIEERQDFGKLQQLDDKLRGKRQEKYLISYGWEPPPIKKKERLQLFQPVWAMGQTPASAPGAREVNEIGTATMLKCLFAKCIGYEVGSMIELRDEVVMSGVPVGPKSAFYSMKRDQHYLDDTLLLGGAVNGEEVTKIVCDTCDMELIGPDTLVVQGVAYNVWRVQVVNESAAEWVVRPWTWFSPNPFRTVRIARRPVDMDRAWKRVSVIKDEKDRARAQFILLKPYLTERAQGVFMDLRSGVVSAPDPASMNIKEYAGAINSIARVLEQITPGAAARWATPRT